MRTQHYLGIAALIVAASCGGSGGSDGTRIVTAPGGGGGGGTPAACTPGGTTVCLETSNSFNPTSITVAPGTSVTWNNPTGVTHNVTFNVVTGAPANSSNFSSGTFTATFGTAGTYPYHCTIHGLSMSGTIVVR
jgi:plastocyanin